MAREAVVILMILSAVLARSLNLDHTKNDVKPHDRSVKLREIPHRIHLSGHDIIDGFGERTNNNGDRDDVKFTYELVDPVACKLLKPTFGCCWDNRTIANGPNGEGCPACTDQKRSCRKWKEYCHVSTIREVCPETCHACPKKMRICADAELDEIEYCSLYKRFGLCKKQQIYKYCQQTCCGHNARNKLKKNK